MAGLEFTQSDPFRGEIWKFLCKVKKTSSEFSPDLYAKFLAQPSTAFDKKIINDVFRTCPETNQFCEPIESGQNKLFNILKAYSQYDPEISYGQGMNYIAMLLLTQVPSEEDAFWCLVHVMFDRGWRDVYKKSKSKCEQLLKDLDAHLKKKFPDLH